MSDDSVKGPLGEQALAKIEARCNAATKGPWWAEDGRYSWQLFGGCPDDNTPCHGLQILKAPKVSEEFAEYWPNPADAAFIIHARTDVPALMVELARVRRVAVAGLEATKAVHSRSCGGQNLPGHFVFGRCICGADAQNAATDAAIAEIGGGANG